MQNSRNTVATWSACATFCLPSTTSCWLNKPALKDHGLEYNPRQSGLAPRAKPSEHASKISFSLLFNEIEQIGACRLTHCRERCLPGGFCVGQVAYHGSQVRPSNFVLLLRQLRSLAAEIGLLRIELVHGVPVKDALRTNVAVGAADFIDGCADARAVLQAGNEILNALKHVIAGSGKQLRTGQVGLKFEVIAQGNAVDPQVSLVGHAGWRAGGEDVWRGLGRGSREDVVALVGKVRQAD